MPPQTVPREATAPVTRVLVVTAVAAERDAVLSGLGKAGRATDWNDPSYRGQGVDVVVVGVGPSAAAAGTGAALAVAGAGGYPYHQVIALGIGGGFAGRAAISDVVVGTRSIAADLGADTPDGFLPIEALGFGRNAYDTDKALTAALLAGLPGAIAGAILTVSTVTGSARRAEDLVAAHPDAAAEAMEGYGAATAAAMFEVPFAEVRAVSNLVGPRDRDAWRIGDALAALSAVAQAVGTLEG
jgi:futalosine hydrolase